MNNHENSNSIINPKKLKIMKPLPRILFIVSVLFLQYTNGYSQSCVIARVPSSASLPIGGGTISNFSIIRYNNCTPVFSTNYSWLSYTYQTVDNTHGLLKITATANPGQPRTGYVYVDNKESLKITIDQAGYAYVTGVSVNPPSVYLNINEQKTLTAIVAPGNANNQAVTWSSSNTSIATVVSTTGSNTGVVKGIAPGTAIITATSNENLYIKGTSTVIVSNVVKSFDWSNRNGACYITSPKNQGDQGPCKVFAAVGITEAKYKIQNNLPMPYSSTGDINLAEVQFNLYCLSPGYFEFDDVFEKMKTRGVVNETCAPYSFGRMMDAYTPMNCNQPCSSPQINLKINSYTSINFAAMNANTRSDFLRNTIMQQGPVAIYLINNMELHNGHSHAYEVYGWNEATWLLKDSWPNAPCLNHTVENVTDNMAASGELAYYIGSVTNTFKKSAANAPVVEIWENGDDVTGIYPNPAKDLVVLRDFPSEGGFVQIYQMDGCVVYSGQVKGNQLDISNLSQGMYFVKLTVDQKSKILKLIKQ
jgi:hypothetical protein